MNAQYILIIFHIIIKDKLIYILIIICTLIVTA